MERAEKFRYPTSSLVKKTERRYEDWDVELLQWPGDKKVIEDGDGEVRINDLRRWCDFSTYPNAKRSRWLTGDGIVAYLKLFRNPKGTVVNTLHFNCFQRAGTLTGAWVRELTKIKEAIDQGLERILHPIHCFNEHWMIIEIHPKKGTFRGTLEIFDPFGTKLFCGASYMKKSLFYEFIGFMLKSGLIDRGYEWDQIQPNIPQRGEEDCGIYCAIFGKDRILGVPMTDYHDDRENSERVRKEICQSLYLGRDVTQPPPTEIQDRYECTSCKTVYLNSTDYSNHRKFMHPITKRRVCAKCGHNIPFRIWAKHHGGLRSKRR